MLRSGRWELGGHTLTHANLAKLSNEQKKTEITDCRTQLEQQFSTKVSSFAYPFGIYDDEDVALTKAAGYSSAVTTEAGITQEDADIFRLKRVKISGEDNRLAFWFRLRSGFRGRS
jgi:peptidoglycan/xylan/chitin deacetylase (PgdA/CDA1 family)